MYIQKYILIYLVLFSFFATMLTAKEFTNTSYYVAYNKADKTEFALVMPSVNKIYTHKAGHILAKDLHRVDEQFTSFPTYNNGKLCFSSLVNDATEEYGTSIMKDNCYQIDFFYTQKEIIPKEGVAFILTYIPTNTVYEGLAGDAKSFKIVRQGEVVYNKNSITNEKYDLFHFNINNGYITLQETQKDDEFNVANYKGLSFYYRKLSYTNYKLTQMNDEEFNLLNDSQKLLVAHKLLSTFFFGYPLKKLEEKINSDTFISTLRDNLENDVTDKGWLEDYIIDDSFFRQYNKWYSPQAITILTRFYAMKHLDKYFIHNWIAYILTQTIMFSPAYELESTHTSNIANTYNRIVTMLNVDSGMRYMTYVHMMSEDNWRRFRSPEDNGREMLEIYTLDGNDSHVPIAARALKNWKLNTDSDTLEVSLNENRLPLELFGETIYNGDDFYRELVKSEQFTYGVSSRLVDFFFPKKSEDEKKVIITSIVNSKPESWKDILYQIVFSKTYLLHNVRAESAEEIFYSLTKIMDFKHRSSTFYDFKRSLENMHQATMKYKLGKLQRVPLDTLSFAYYNQYIRDSIILRRSDPKKNDDYDAWNRQGWSDSFIANNNFKLNSRDDEESLKIYINYLFKSLIAREANSNEITLFTNHMIEDKDGKRLFIDAFNIFKTDKDSAKQIAKQEERKRNITRIILDYISRLDMTYSQQEVK